MENTLGLVKGDVVDAQYKAKTLQHLLEEYGIYSQQFLLLSAMVQMTWQ